MLLADGVGAGPLPYIVTAAEVRRRKRRIIVFVLGSVLLLIGVLTGAYLFLPPLDLMIAKAGGGLFR